MTRRLKEVFTRASQLPAREQDRLAEWLMEELAADKRWNEMFAQSQSALSKLAEHAVREDKEGSTDRLDPDHL